MADLGDALRDVADNIRGPIRQFGQETENFGFFSSIVLIQLLLVSLRKNRTPSRQTFNETYDYIIVGAGTAGSVLANRLTEKPCVSVLLLEAGDEPPILTDVPGLARAFYGSRIDWNYKTTSQTYAAFGQKENRVILNNGKVIGGSGTLGAMQAVRGNKKDYDQWADEGATGWSYDDVFPYFLKLEDNRNIDELDEGYHSTGGPMTWEKVNYTPEHKYPIITAISEMGYEVRDINGENQTGIYDIQVTARNQERWSTARAYLDPARERPNLDVLTKAYARKILINERTKEAYGVEFDHGGETHRVRARREIIVANGALKTPQLLILSGIGPREQLEKLNIDVVADLPVGKNLMDHFASSLIYTVSKTIRNIFVKNLSPISSLEYVSRREGPLCSPTQIFLLAFLNGMNNTNSPIDFPEQGLAFGEYDVIDLKINMNLKDEVYDRAFKRYEKNPAYICLASLLRPYGRGEITLNSTDPYDMPLINPNYHQDERDLRNVVEGLKKCNAIASHPALKEIKAEPLETVFPGCEEDVGDEDRYLTCYARQYVNTFWHYSGTARMGRRNETTSVVDPELKVIGVESLRIVSAAIFPLIPSGYTDIPTVMVAEKASDIIKKDIKCEGEDTR